MKEFWSMIQMVFAGIGAWIGWFLGGCDGLMYALVAFVVIDYVTGIMCAVVDRRLSSEIGFKGICRKVFVFLLVGIANILDVQVIGSGSVVRTAVIFFYLSNEGISILENAAYLGLPIPEKLKRVLEQLHNRAEKEENLPEKTEKEETDAGKEKSAQVQTEIDSESPDYEGEREGGMDD